MSYILVLTSNPAAPALDPGLAEAARQAVAGAQPRWLMPGVACEIALPGPIDEMAARQALGDAPLDVAVVPANHRRKQLLVADMDSTIIGQECIDELADVLGIKPQVAAITERAMRGEIAFEPALRERVALLGGLATEAVDRVIAERVRPNPGAATLVATMRAHGAYTALVSGGFTLFTAKVAGSLGFHSHHANVLLVKNGRLTGAVAEPVLGRDAKRQTLVSLTARLGITAADTLAVGDGANDLAMIEAAGLGIAFHAKPAVAAAADARVDHCDLTALLFLQGYAAEDFVDASEPAPGSA